MRWRWALGESKFRSKTLTAIRLSSSSPLDKERVDYDATVSRSLETHTVAGRRYPLSPSRRKKGKLIRLSTLMEEPMEMAKTFKRGDHVKWNSEAGRVTGIVQKKITSETVFKGYKRHASKEEPQYIIKSDKTDHIAIHKGSSLVRIRKRG
jgi:Hypervirulence associated proteins TUDOR domain